jgi:hypothetical protein
MTLSSWFAILLQPWIRRTSESFDPNAIERRGLTHEAAGRAAGKTKKPAQAGFLLVVAAPAFNRKDGCAWVPWP